jgi:SNF2 family DNA or RNA helicase
MKAAPMKFKTKGFKHQLRALRLSQDEQVFALLMEQGTGKSWVIVLTAAHLFLAHKIDTVIIIAPKGVAPGWVRQQFPEHMPDNVPYKCALWKSKSNMTKTGERGIRETMAPGGDWLKVIVMNTEAFGSTEDALDFAIEVLDAAHGALVVVDESSRIKNLNHTTKRIINLRIRSDFRRILTGTPITQGPFDAFHQFKFLNPAILEVDSFVAFKKEYAELEPETSGLMRHITRRVPKKWSGKYINDDTGQPADGAFNDDGSKRLQHMVPVYLPTIVARNEDGTPRYKNLDKLQQLIAPYSFRVLKRDCLDLPPKLYSRYYTELTPRQQELYEKVKEEQRIQWEDGSLTPLSKLTLVLRLQQIVCGYLGDGAQIIQLFNKWSENPRAVSLLEYIGDRPMDEGTIIWCRFIEDIRQVSEGLREAYGDKSVVQFYGAVSPSARITAVERFQGEKIIIDKRTGAVLRQEPIPNAQRARFMVAQQRAGGIGQTWTAANLSFYYSNTFSLEDRLQSEDRPHRIGQKRSVQYTDMEAEGTVDGNIITSLIGKKEVADAVTGDPAIDWLGRR